MTHAEIVLSSHGRSSTGGGISGAAAGLAADVAALRASSNATGPQPPPLTSGDWARRGFLAERLGHTHDARTAFRVAVTLGFSLSAYTRLLGLEAAAGALADALMSAQQLLLWHETQAAALLGTMPTSGGGGAAAGGTLLTHAPVLVQWFLAELAAAPGAEHVRRALSDDLEAPHPLLAKELDAWQKLQDRDAVSL